MKNVKAEPGMLALIQDDSLSWTPCVVADVDSASRATRFRRGSRRVEKLPLSNWLVDSGRKVRDPGAFIRLLKRRYETKEDAIAHARELLAANDYG